MKKTGTARVIAPLLAVLLCVFCFAACGDSSSDAGGSQPTAADAAQPASGDPEPAATEAADSGVKMTDSYRAGRQAYYDITGIWMPEVAGFEAEYDANPRQDSIAFDSRGDRELYEAAKAVLVQALGEPRAQDDISAYWTVVSEDGVTQNYDVYYHESADDGTWVFMNFYAQKDN